MSSVQHPDRMKHADFDRFLEQLRSGDEQTWQTLYFVLKKYVKYWLELKGTSSADAEQLYHDAFTVFYERFSDCRFESFQKLRAYVLAIASNKLKEHFKCNAKQTKKNTHALQIVDHSFEKELYQVEIKQVVEGLLQSLSDRERQILHKYYIDKIKLKTIVKELGISEENGWVVKHRALKKAQKLIREFLQ